MKLRAQQTAHTDTQSKQNVAKSKKEYCLMAESQTTDYALVWETSASLASQSRLSLRPRVIGSSGKAFCSKCKFNRHFEEKKNRNLRGIIGICRINKEQKFSQIVNTYSHIILYYVLAYYNTLKFKRLAS